MIERNRIALLIVFPGSFSLEDETQRAVSSYYPWNSLKWTSFLPHIDLCLMLLQVWKGHCWRRGGRCSWWEDGEQLRTTVSELKSACPHTVCGRCRSLGSIRGGQAGPAELPAGQRLASGCDTTGQGLSEGGGHEDRTTTGGPSLDWSEHRHNTATGCMSSLFYFVVLSDIMLNVMLGISLCLWAGGGYIHLINISLALARSSKLSHVHMSINGICSNKSTKKRSDPSCNWFSIVSFLLWHQRMASTFWILPMNL